MELNLQGCKINGCFELCMKQIHCSPKVTEYSDLFKEWLEASRNTHRRISEKNDGMQKNITEWFRKYGKQMYSTTQYIHRLLLIKYVWIIFIWTCRSFTSCVNQGSMLTGINSLHGKIVSISKIDQLSTFSQD